MDKSIVDFLNTRKMTGYSVSRSYYVSYGTVYEQRRITVKTDVGHIILTHKQASEEMVEEMKKIFKRKGHTNDDNIG